MGCLFGDGDFVNATLVATAFEIGAEENVDNGNGFVITQESSRERQHIGIVVATREACNLRSPAECRANALVLVERHVDAFAATADSYSWITLAAFNGFGAEVSEVGIIAAVFAESSEIGVFDSVGFKVVNHSHFGGITGVVAAQCNWFVGVYNQHDIVELL